MTPVILSLLVQLLAHGMEPPAVATAATSVPSANTAELRADLESALNVPGWSNDRWSVMVVSLDAGDTLFAHAANRDLAPASNMKLYTAAAALYYLGADFRYVTYLATDGELDAGTVRGDLYLYGTGDPTIGDRLYEGKLTVFEQLADSLAALGITAVDGDVVGDASFFDGVSAGGGWHESYMNAWYAAPASSLTFNEGLVTLRVRPAEQPGWRPRVDLIPGGTGISIVNQATTVASGRSRIEVDRAAYDGPAVVEGQTATGHSAFWRSVPVADPARYTAAVFREVLQSRGIRIRGGIRSINRAEDSPFLERSVFAPAFEDASVPRILTAHRSPPLNKILEPLVKRSHNLYAELALRTVGRIALGAGTVQAGETAISQMLECETPGASIALRVFDGSGLSELNRTDAASVVHLLSFMRDSPQWEAYRQSLVAAGERGLRRMGNSPAVGNLRAKTGTINNVSALSGYVTAANGELLAFSILSNGVPSTWKAKRVEDRIGTRLAEFSRPVPVTTRPTRPLAAADTGAVRADDAGARDTATTAPATEAPEPEPQEPGPEQHVIRPGDTLEGIAQQYGTTVSALREANAAINPRRLIPGRSINLP